MCAGADTPTAKFFINCLAEPPEEVARYLVPRIRKVPQEMRSIGGGIGQVALISSLISCVQGVSVKIPPGVRACLTKVDCHAGDIHQIPDKDEGVQPDHRAACHRRTEEQVCARGVTHL